MGLGVLDNTDGHHVPGTVILDQSAAGPSESHEHLKRGSGKESHIVLVPQPADDPNDPLNWSNSKKLAVFATILLGTTFVCVVPVWSPLFQSSLHCEVANLRYRHPC